MVMRITSLLIGYLFGCFLTADVVCRVRVHRSAFEVGVGNPGMANVGHELGTGAAALVLLGDILKTLLAWLVVRALFPDSAALAGMWSGVGATLGHDFPFWHRFRGGKGVTTTCSAIILANPLCGITASVLGFVIVVLSGYLCIGGLAIPLIFTLFMLLVGTPELTALAALLALLALYAHGSAIRGIRDKTTPRATLSTTFWAKVADHKKHEE